MGDKVIDQMATIPWNANATVFCTGLNAFDWFKSSTFGVSCTVAMKNSIGADTIDVGTAVEFTWTVSIEKFRTDKGYDFTVKYSDVGGKFTKNQVQEHSPLLSGTFTASIGVV